MLRHTRGKKCSDLGEEEELPRTRKGSENPHEYRVPKSLLTL